MARCRATATLGLAGALTMPFNAPSSMPVHRTGGAMYRRRIARALRSTASRIDSRRHESRRAAPHAGLNTHARTHCTCTRTRTAPAPAHALAPHAGMHARTAPHRTARKARCRAARKRCTASHSTAHSGRTRAHRHAHAAHAAHAAQARHGSHATHTTQRHATQRAQRTQRTHARTAHAPRLAVGRAITSFRCVCVRRPVENDFFFWKAGLFRDARM